MTKQVGSRRGLQVLWPNISTVIFDVEGTLVDAVPLTLLGWQETLEEHGFAVSQSVLQCLSGMDGHDMLTWIAPGLSRASALEMVLRLNPQHYRTPTYLHYRSAEFAAAVAA
jgi:beta-phosphoglucomutase-like phosphatase (HAD superfamily)